MEITRDNLVVWFIKNHNTTFFDMKNTEHTYGDNVSLFKDNINPFHAESVWEHTLMTMTVAECLDIPKDEKSLLLLTMLLHDLGKPITQDFAEATDDKPNRYRFQSHEGISTFMALDILTEMKDTFDITESDVKMVVKLVSLHGVALDERETKLGKLRKLVRYCDKKGAIRQVDEDIYSQYEPRKYAKGRKPQEDKEVVFMVGLPASGKDTWIKENLPNHAVLSRDNLLFDYLKTNKGVEAETYNEAYGLVHNDEESRKEFNKYFDNSVAAHARAYDKVVVSMTMMSLKSRRSMLNSFSKHTAKAVVMLPTTNELARRNEVRAKEGKHIPFSAYTMMSKQFVFPVLEEGFESITTVL
jgi:hypothetical protein